MTSPDVWHIDLPKPPGELITAFFQALEPHLQPYNNLDLLSRRTRRAILPARPLVHDLSQKLPDLYHPFVKALVEWRESTIPSRLGFEEEIIFHLLFDNSAVELDGWTHRIYADLDAPGKHDCTFNVNSEEKPACSNLIQWCHVIAETLLDGPFQHLGILPPKTTWSSSPPATAATSGNRAAPTATTALSRPTTSWASLPTASSS